MKAAIRRKFGPPEQIKIENIDQPIPKDHEVLVKVFATTVNRTDCANLTARPLIMRLIVGFFKPRKIILGTDFSGEVIKVGKKVKSIRLHDRVFGFNDLGINSQAEYTAVPEKELFMIPKDIDFKIAAASLEGAHYAYTFIHKVDIKAGQKVLINGATGAIGSALLQFVRQYKVKVTATCDTKNIGLVKALGADKIYDYSKQDFTQDKDQYDYIFDAVGKSTFGKCKPLLKKRGVYISSELGPYSQNVFYALSTILSKRKKVIFPIPYNRQITIPYISRLLEKGMFNPVIDRDYDLDEISDAYKYVIRGKKTGNVVINLNNSAAV